MISPDWSVEYKKLRDISKPATGWPPPETDSEVKQRELKESKEKYADDKAPPTPEVLEERSTTQKGLENGKRASWEARQQWYVKLR
jgi:hypothetical protein